MVQQEGMAVHCWWYLLRCCCCCCRVQRQGGGCCFDPLLQVAPAGRSHGLLLGLSGRDSCGLAGKECRLLVSYDASRAPGMLLLLSRAAALLLQPLKHLCAGRCLLLQLLCVQDAARGGPQHCCCGCTIHPLHPWHRARGTQHCAATTSRVLLLLLLLLLLPVGSSPQQVQHQLWAAGSQAQLNCRPGSHTQGLPASSGCVRSQRRQPGLQQDGGRCCLP